MQQLNFQVQDDIAQAIREQAGQCGKTVSEFLAELVASKVHPVWTTHYQTRILGGRRGESPQRPEQMPAEQRDAW